ncbi:MAG: hypothetical protein ACE5EF_10830, partial [Dehalococcoidia bacterium]
MRITAALGAALAAIAISGIVPAYADHGVSTLSVDVSQPTAGDPIAVAAAVSTVTGEPVTGADVTYYYLAQFGGTRGFVPLGHAVTDERGVATLNFTPRATGEIQLRATVAVDGEDDVGVATTDINISPTTEQLYKEAASIELFGHEWILVGVLGAVWTVLFLVVLGIADIATGFTAS